MIIILFLTFFIHQSGKMLNMRSSESRMNKLLLQNRSKYFVIIKSLNLYIYLYLDISFSTLKVNREAFSRKCLISSKIKYFGETRSSSTSIGEQKPQQGWYFRTIYQEPKRVRDLEMRNSAKFLAFFPK